MHSKRGSVLFSGGSNYSFLSVGPAGGNQLLPKLGPTILFYEPLLNNELQGMYCELLEGRLDYVVYILVSPIGLLLALLTASENGQFMYKLFVWLYIVR